MFFRALFSVVLLIQMVFSRRFHVKAEPVRDHGDELGIRRLAARVVDGVAKIGIENVHIANPHEYWIFQAMDNLLIQ
jgi:hypothetical protein